MAAAAALHSDHLNFLIYRYLQEFGHEKTARAFYRDWRRPVEHDDPESFPFAPAVQRNDLVSVIQDGLHHDELQARVRKCERRFRWTSIEARESVERHDGLIENGVGARLPSRTKRKPRLPPHLRAADDFLEPASKRRRRSEGSDAQVNGDRDAMDVDVASASADAEEDNDAISPIAASEVEGAEAMVRYDSMEVGTQTDAVKTSVMLWKIDRPGAFVSQCLWNPSSDPKNSRSLLAVGDALCRFYQLPESITSDGQEITHADVSLFPPDSIVTSSAWRPDGSAASCAIDSVREIPEAVSISSQTLVEYSRDTGSVLFQPGPSPLEPPGLVLQLRYSPDGEYLLSTRTNLKRGSIQVWRTPKPIVGSVPTPTEPIAWRLFEHPVHDACWISEDVFVVCGVDGLSSVYKMSEQTSAVKSEGTDTSPPSSHGLLEQRASLVDDKEELEKIRYDHRHRIAVFSSTRSKKLIATSRLAEDQKADEPNLVIDLPSPATDLRFQPSQPSEVAVANLEESVKPSHLAVAFEDGTCIIYGISKSLEAGSKCVQIASLVLANSPALALSWSPNGQHLAVSGTDVVQIWHVDSLRRKNGSLHPAEALVSWRRPAEPKALPNGTRTPDTSLSEPSLSWSVDGESLAFAVEQKIAVIRFRPPLNASNTPGPEINGRPSSE